MAAVGKVVSVAVTPTKLNSASTVNDPTVGSSLLITNRGASSVYLGASGVTTATGYELQAGQSIPLDLGAGEDFYAICASGTVSCHILEVGV